jgi:paraquat-inducible protein A
MQSEQTLIPSPSRPAAAPSPPPPPEAAAFVQECHDCGLLQTVGHLVPHTVARCPRCHAVLRRARANPVTRSLALTCTGLLLFVLANNLPFIDVRLSGIDRVTSLATGPIELAELGMWPLTIVIVIATIAAPLARMMALLAVLAGLQMRRPFRWLPAAFRWAHILRPWAMIEVFLLGVLVAYTKLIDLATVDLEGAVYSLGALMLAMAAADAALDPHVVWSEMQRRGITAAPMAADAPATPAELPRRPVACECCKLVTAPARSCPRCGAALHRRKPQSLARTFAFLVAGFILYLPANILPVMTVIRLGSGAPNTIISGVEELAASGMWPLAALVFVASITVPVLKLIGLSLLLITTRRGSLWRLHERTVIYRIVDGIGRWSMIDVFMVSILTALVRMGRLAAVYPNAGVLAFCSVVILTMFSAMSFDPRLMWDAAATRLARDRAHALAPHAARQPA